MTAMLAEMIKRCVNACQCKIFSADLATQVVIRLQQYRVVTRSSKVHGRRKSSQACTVTFSVSQKSAEDTNSCLLYNNLPPRPYLPAEHAPHSFSMLEFSPLPPVTGLVKDLSHTKSAGKFGA